MNDLDYDPTGKRFLSASYDRHMKLWDTETGQCIARFSTGKIPHVIRFNPASDTPNEFLAGMSDKKIVQFDTRSGEMTQEYGKDLSELSLHRQFETDFVKIIIWRLSTPWSSGP